VLAETLSYAAADYPAVRDALYSARDSASLVAGREFGFHAC